MARVFEMAPGYISLTRGIHCCPNSFHFFCPTRISTLWRICVYMYIPACAETVYDLPLLPNRSANEICLHKSGAVWSVDWIFINRAPAGRLLGEYMTLDRTFYTPLFQTENSSNHSYRHISFFIAFLEEAFNRNVIILWNNYRTISVNSNAIIVIMEGSKTLLCS
jgi:hypothetical protein